MVTEEREIEDYCEVCGAGEEDDAVFVICEGFLVCEPCAKTQGMKLAEFKDAMRGELTR